MARATKTHQAFEESIETVRRLNARRFAGFDRAIKFRDHLRSQRDEVASPQLSRKKSASVRKPRRFEPRLRDRVQDRWFSDWGVGTVIRRLKTRATIRFPHGELTYDRAHFQFLEKVVPVRKKKALK